MVFTSVTEKGCNKNSLHLHIPYSNFSFVDTAGSGEGRRVFLERAWVDLLIEPQELKKEGPLVRGSLLRWPWTALAPGTSHCVLRRASPAKGRPSATESGFQAQWPWALPTAERKQATCLGSVWDPWAAELPLPWAPRAYFYTTLRAHTCYRTEREWGKVHRPLRI